MMKLLGRYIMRELTAVFFLTLFIFTLVLFLGRLLRLTELVINKGVPLATVLKLLAYLSPSFLILIIPVSVLVASITVFRRLSVDSEIVVMKATGMSFFRMLIPVALLSVAAYAATSYLIWVAFPVGNRAFQETMFEILQSQAALELHPRVFNDTFSGLVIYAQDVSPARGLVRGVFIADSRQPREPQTIVAQRGRLIPDPARKRLLLELEQGSIHKLLPGKERYQLLHFRRHELALDLAGLLAGARAKKGVKQMSGSELRHLASKSPPGSRMRNIALVEYYKKFSLPVACLLLGFVGAPLGMVHRRTGRSGGFLASTIAVLIYYLLYTTSEGLGDEGRLPPLLAVWLPNAAAFLAALYLVTKTARESPFTMAEAVAGRLSRGGQALRRLIPRPAKT